MRSHPLVLIAFLLALAACGSPSNVTATNVATSATGPAAVPTTTLGSTTLVKEPTLGVTPEQFVADWNRLLAVHSFLLIDVSPVENGTSMTRRFSDDWHLELTVDAESGELTVAELRASTNVHTDQIILRYLSMLTLVQASNPRLEFGWDEDFVWVTERLGLPRFDGQSGEADGFATGNYESEGEINGVFYRYEESHDDAVLTARTAP